MQTTLSRRALLRTGGLATAALAVPADLFGSGKKSVLVFTKSSGFEHDVVKRIDGKPSIVENTVTSLGNKYGFDVTPTKDGRVFDTKDFYQYAAVFFFTTGDLTKEGTDKNPAHRSYFEDRTMRQLGFGMQDDRIFAASTRTLSSGESRRSPSPVRRRPAARPSGSSSTWIRDLSVVQPRVKRTCRTPLSSYCSMKFAARPSASSMRK